ncbi:fumarylacetoacetate hydrolase family protein [Bacillus sp. DJP31]|uniref:fumarylacetoacetate hydrolase family protein n=1 Tax=Bacillus sp. DJP31 TaxID=3409789 RepID=UPI003BB79A71
MKFVTAKLVEGIEFIGLVVGEQILHLKKAETSIKREAIIPDTMIEAIGLGDLFFDRVSQIFSEIHEVNSEFIYDLSSIGLLAPIPYPRKNVFCIGKNYADHAIEMGSSDDIPENIIVFTKAPTAVVGSGATIQNHRQITNQLDYEGELAVIIGKRGKAISEEEARSHIFGYTIINDITARDLQAKHKQFFLGKSLDSSCPMGPWIVHHSEIVDSNNLGIKTTINGDTRQDSNTNQMIFSVEKIISILSQGMTLEPGDIIATGTPAGVGKGFKPPIYLKPGDKIEITLEGIGTLVNTIEE